MTSEDVAKIVKRLRGIYPASPYRLDEELVITTWRANQELQRHSTEHLPAMYDRIMKQSKMFPALSEVLAVLRDLEKGKFHPPVLADTKDSRATGYGPIAYAGYIEGIQERNQAHSSQVEALDYNTFMMHNFAQEHARETAHSGGDHGTP
jgi:hypothetical protein